MRINITNPMFFLIIVLEIFYIFMSRSGNDFAMISSNNYLFSIFLSIILILFAIVNKYKLYTGFVFLAFFPIIGLVTFFLHTNPMQSFLSFLNYYLTLLNLIFFYAFLKENNLFHKFLTIYIQLTYVIVFFGLIQVLGFVEFSSRSYLTSSQELSSFGIIRITSIFDEPSALSFFLLPAIIISLYLKKHISYIIFTFTIFLSMSIFGFLGVVTLSIGYFIIRSDNKFNFLIFLLAFLSLLFSLIYFDISYFHEAYEVVLSRLSNINDQSYYRIYAPLALFEGFLSDGPSFLFGHGISQISQYTQNYWFPEYPNTSHSLIADMLFEVGIIGFILFLVFFKKTFKGRNDLLLISFIFIILGFGWRSPSLILVVITLLALKNISLPGPNYKCL